MKRLYSFFGVALLATVFFTACEPKEPSGSGNTTQGVVINGIRWATRNVDAFGTFVKNPEDIGMFYQYNRPNAWAAIGTVIGWNSSTPSGTTWTAANDPSPDGWRVPTKAEIESLLNITYVSNEWTALNGTNGWRFTDIATGNSIFFPIAGYRSYDDGALYFVGDNGEYWSSTSITGETAYSLGFCGLARMGGFMRSYGYSIRPVAK